MLPLIPSPGLEDMTPFSKDKGNPHSFSARLSASVSPVQVAPMKEITTTAPSNGRALQNPVSYASAR